MKTAIQLREAWLNKVAEELRPTFKRLGYEYTKFRVSCGFPSAGRKGRAIGECWAAECSKDAHHEIFIHPARAESVDVAAILAHEIAHAVVGLAAKHGAKFKRVAKGLGLEGRACATVPGEAFKKLIAPIIESVGQYPHATLGIPAEGVSSNGPKQTTRLVKVECPGCDYTMRVTRKWLEIAVPTCPNPDCGSHGEEMNYEEAA